MYRVFVVADSAILGGLMSFALETEGFEVTTLGHCEPLMKLIADEPPDVMILDMSLPDLNGSEMCAHACEKLGIPLIILAVPGLSERRLKTGPLNAYRCVLMKPFSFTMLLQEVFKSIETKRNSVSAA
jgi:DNA-binding response OmpR family regulator